MTRFTSLLSTLALTSAIAGAASAATTFPTAGDGTYNVNLIRRFTQPGVLSTQVQVLNEVNTGHAGYDPYWIADGAGEKLQWGGAVSDANATATVRITLDTVYSIKKFTTTYLDPGYLPVQYEIRTSTDGLTWATPVPFGAAPVQVQTNTVAPVMAKYIEYQWKGIDGDINPYVLVQEFEAFADVATNPFVMDSYGGWDMTALSGVTATALNGNWIDGVGAIIDHDTFSYLRGNGVADALVLVDLGSVQLADAVTLGFYQSQTWGNGVKIRASGDGVNYVTVFDTHASLNSSQSIDIPRVNARFFEITDYGGSGGALTNFAVFAPEPASLVLLVMGGMVATRRRRA